MDRRTFLAAGAASLAATAGCLAGGGGGGGDYAVTPSDGDVDGYPPEFEETPAERDIDTSSFETVRESGVDVPLAPIEAAYYWYRRGEARFADARGQRQYEAARIYGAVLSPAVDRAREEVGDPVTEWPKGDRIVCYCGCPHHLSSIRASKLIQNGYENVFVIDEGFGEWQSRDYPMAGDEVENPPEKRVIRGETDPASAGGNAWARHEPSGQVESTDIGSDGGYELHLKFYDVEADSLITVETPDYTIEGTLDELTSETVQG